MQELRAILGTTEAESESCGQLICLLKSALSEGRPEDAATVQRTQEHLDQASRELDRQLQLLEGGAGSAAEALSHQGRCSLDAPCGSTRAAAMAQCACSVAEQAARLGRVLASHQSTAQLDAARFGRTSGTAAELEDTISGLHRQLDTMHAPEADSDTDPSSRSLSERAQALLPRLERWMRHAPAIAPTEDAGVLWAQVRELYGKHEAVCGELQRMRRQAAELHKQVLAAEAHAAAADLR